MKNNPKNWGSAAFAVKTGTHATFTIHVCGRDRWALEYLMHVGDEGCTPLINPAPRWSGYVHNLRNMNVHIETLHEPHDGPFPGTHARYVLRSCVVRAESGEAAA